MHSLLPAGSFFGNTMRAQHSHDFQFVEARLLPDTRVPLHEHETTSLYLIVEGACAEAYGRKSRYSEPNALVFHPAAHAHAGVWQGHIGRCFNIEIASQRLADIQTYAPLPLDAVDFSAGLPNQIAQRLYREFLQPDLVSPLAMEGMALELLASISRSTLVNRETVAPRWLSTAVDLIETRFRENLSLAEIAASVDVHQSHLARVFRQHFHCSIGDYVRRLRREYICRQLAASELSLGEIAIAAGFADQSHFTKNFKQWEGVTPAAYRRASRRCTLSTIK